MDHLDVASYHDVAAVAEGAYFQRGKTRADFQNIVHGIRNAHSDLVVVWAGIPLREGMDTLVESTHWAWKARNSILFSRFQELEDTLMSCRKNKIVQIR